LGGFGLSLALQVSILFLNFLDYFFVSLSVYFVLFGAFDLDIEVSELFFFFFFFGSFPPPPRPEIVPYRSFGGF
jgi:hypothetical protein